MADQITEVLIEYKKFVDLIETRAMACDGPVTPFFDQLREASEMERDRFTGILTRLYRLAPSD